MVNDYENISVFIFAAILQNREETFGNACNSLARKYGFSDFEAVRTYYKNLEEA